MREPFGRARVYLSTLLWMEVALGVTIIVLSGYNYRILCAYLSELGRRTMNGQLFNVYMYGFQLIVTFFCSLALWRHVWCRRCTVNVRMLLNVWMLFCFLIVICGFGGIWSLFTCAEGITTSTEMLLLKGIDMYYTCPEWKLLWDGLQYHKECCGVHGYEDWMHASWMPSDALQSDNDNETCPDPSRNMTMAPYACCKHSCASCYENYIPRQDTSGIPSLSLSQINTSGCLVIFTASMSKMLNVLLTLVITTFLLNMCICGLAKYIISKQDIGYCDADGTFYSSTDTGRPCVVVKCPPSVRCVTIEDDDAISHGRCEGGDDIIDPNNCASEVRRGYSVKQEVSRTTYPRSQRFEYIPTAESHILH